MLKFIRSCFKENYPKTKKEIVFVGKSNVGKSSLINKLFNTNIVYTGKKPGKTRMLNFFSYNDITICDVPGYGFANRSNDELIAFGDMMEYYFTNRSNIETVILIFDVRRDLNDDDFDMINYLNNKNINYLVVCNKIDKISNNQLFNRKRYFNSCVDKEILYTSCLYANGINLLKQGLNI